MADHSIPDAPVPGVPVPGVALLGGGLWPIGWSVGFLRAPRSEVVSALAAWRRSLGRWVKTRAAPGPWPQCLSVLDPLDSMWTRELLVDHGGEWTAYLNNSASGGDPAPATGHIAGTLGVEWVLAAHHPLLPVGHAVTQLEVGGPDGEPPLGYRRTISASATDGRWHWEDSGAALPFEKVERYAARKVQDRFPRTTLVGYLKALGIDVDDDDRYGEATLVRQKALWKAKSISVERARSKWLSG